jgi:alpha-tubulin suppressor-like RCC1 family protein
MTTPVPTRSQNDHPTPALSRRTVLTGAAWSVPVIVAVTATPAFAATSQTSVVTASTPGMQTPAAGQVTVTAVVKNSSGAPLSGQPVSFTGPSGTSFSPSSSTTNGSGVATSTMTTTDTWALPGSSVTVTALSNGASGTAPLTVLGANAYSYGNNGSNAAPSGSSTSSPVQLRQAFPSPIVAIATSVSDDTFGNRAPFTVALLKDCTVWAVGTNIQGQMGDGTTTDRATWGRVPGLSGVKEIATQFGAAHALLSDGTIRSWGSNARSQLGNGSSVAYSSTPVTVTGITTAIQLQGGFALLSDGSIRSWGYGYGGRLGNGTTSNSSTPVTVTGITNAARIGAGNYCGYAILSDGTVRSWGFNGSGQLGNGTTTSSSTPVTVTGITNAVEVGGGNGSAYALLADGTIRCWGWNNYGELGDGTTIQRTTPSTVTGINTATAITAVYSGGYALLADGTLKAWGNGPGGSGATPTTITGTQNVTTLANTAFSNGSTTYFVIGDRVITFTNGSATNITAGSTASATAVVQSPGGVTLAGQGVTLSTAITGIASPTSGTTDANGAVSTTVASVDTWAPPGSTITLTANSGGHTGTRGLRVIGANGYYSGSVLGSPDTTAATQLPLVFPSTIVALAAKWGTAFALLADGTVWTVGYNYNGELANGSTQGSYSWTRIAGLSGVVQVAPYMNGAYALLDDGTVKAWGSNAYGQFGDGTTNSSLTPVTIPGLSGVTQIAAAGLGGYALLGDKTVRSWGNNDANRLGNPAATGSTVVTVQGVSGATQVAAAVSSGYALLNDGTVKAWGNNSRGQLGDGTTTNRATAVSVQRLSGVRQVTASGYSAFALLSDGTVKSWGPNTYGVLGTGQGTTGNATSLVPVTIPGLTDVRQITASQYSAYALLTDGTVQAWGLNEQRQLGDGTRLNRDTPVTVHGAHDVSALMSSNTTNNSLFLVRDPSVYAVAGQTVVSFAAGQTSTITAGATANVAATVTAAGLGAVSRTNVSFSAGNAASASPSSAQTDSSGVASTTVTSTDTWTRPGDSIALTADVAGRGNTTYLQVVGANAYVVGNNETGQLGTGTTGDVSTPVQTSLVFPAPIVSMSSGFGNSRSWGNTSYALLADGTVWSAGSNAWGQLGTSGGDRSTWQQVPGLPRIIQVAAGGGCVLALEEAGEIWAWGVNNVGQLGIGSTVASTSTPTRVQNIDFAAQVEMGALSGYARLRNGEVWAWGRNFQGQLGNGDTADTNVPVQVSNITDATKIAAAGSNCYALLSSGSVMSWGRGGSAVGDGRTGGRTAVDATTPVTVSNITTAVDIVAASSAGIVRLTDGTVWKWGSLAGTSTTPIQVSGLSNVAQIAAGENAAYALQSDGSLLAWGYNDYGQLGDGTTTDRTTPVSVIGTSNVKTLPRNGSQSNSMFFLR